jgi:hypothetical protein
MFCLTADELLSEGENCDRVAQVIPEPAGMPAVLVGGGVLLLWAGHS